MADEKVFNAFIKTEEGLVPVANYLSGIQRTGGDERIPEWIDFNKPDKQFLFPIGITGKAMTTPLGQLAAPRSSIVNRVALPLVTQKGFYCVTATANANQLYRINLDTLEVMAISTSFLSIDWTWSYGNSIYLVGRRTNATNYYMYRIDQETLNVEATSSEYGTANSFFTFVQFTQNGLYFRRSTPNPRTLIRLNLMTLANEAAVEPPAAAAYTTGFAAWNGGVAIMYRANTTNTTSYQVIVYNPLTLAVVRTAMQFGTNVNAGGFSITEVFLFKATNDRIFLTCRATQYTANPDELHATNPYYQRCGSISIAGLMSDPSHIAKAIPEVNIWNSTKAILTGTSVVPIPTMDSSGTVTGVTSANWTWTWGDNAAMTTEGVLQIMDGGIEDDISIMPSLNAWINYPRRGATRRYNYHYKVDKTTGAALGNNYMNDISATEQPLLLPEVLTLSPAWSELDNSCIILKWAPSTSQNRVVDNITQLVQYKPIDITRGRITKEVRILAEGMSTHSAYFIIDNRIYAMNASGLEMFIMKGV